MPDPITGTVLAASGVIGGIGASKAASAQKQGGKDQLALQREMFQQQTDLMSPYARAGAGGAGLEGLMGLSTPGGQADFYSGYFDSPQYLAQANQAQNQQLAASEATGGLQSTSTQNQLARIAPQLGMQAMQQQLGQYTNMANLGLGAATQQGGYMQNFAQQGGQSIGDIATARAGQAQVPWQVAGQGLQGIASGRMGGQF